MKKSLTTSLICLTGLLFTPTASYAQCDPPEIPYEQDNEYEAVALYVENSECGDGAPFASNFASTFLNILKENGYMGKYIPNISVDYWDFTDSTIWEDGRDHINPSEDTDDFGTDWADAVFFVTHGMPDEVGNGASYFMMGADNNDSIPTDDCDGDMYCNDTCYITTRGRYTPLWPFSENPWRPCAFG